MDSLSNVAFLSELFTLHFTLTLVFSDLLHIDLEGKITFQWIKVCVALCVVKKVIALQRL